jgi:hypothetical protein
MSNDKYESKIESKVEIEKFDLPKDPASEMEFDHDKYYYRDVIFTYEKEGSARVAKFEKRGYEIVYSIKDSTSEGKEKKVYSPVILDKKPVHKAVRMRILKDKFHANAAEKRKQDEERRLRSVNLKKVGDHQIMQDTAVLDLNNLNDLED